MYQTETAYAIGCDATNQKAVDLVFIMKKRLKKYTLPLIAESLDMIKKFCQMSDAEEHLAKKYWPGALTMVLKVASNQLAKGIVAKDETVAVRVSGNKMARELSRRLGQPIVSTSANLHGNGECYSLSEVRKHFGCHSDPALDAVEESLVMLDGGVLEKRKPSTIVKIVNGKIKILRQGEIKI